MLVVLIVISGRQTLEGPERPAKQSARPQAAHRRPSAPTHRRHTLGRAPLRIGQIVPTTRGAPRDSHPPGRRAAPRGRPQALDKGAPARQVIPGRRRHSGAARAPSRRPAGRGLRLAHAYPKARPLGSPSLRPASAAVADSGVRWPQDAASWREARGALGRSERRWLAAGCLAASYWLAGWMAGHSHAQLAGRAASACLQVGRRRWRDAYLGVWGARGRDLGRSAESRSVRSRRAVGPCRL